ncbi:hypothetical protein CMI38_05565 [Candidatus Pacearchaeota archaeon]|nr:hypothetical protein [Candidatus Pacearchaeota archaeon]|tara:strand:- start:3772 stop:5136 length:1365 start_codon:yes stop_codon:yes gene_type:complete
MDNNISKTFCIYPWMHQMIDTDGSVKLCCVAEAPTKKLEGSHMHVSKNKLSHLWNDEYMKDIRERMIQGKQIKDCGQCYRKERNNEYSFRQRANDDWANKVKEVKQYYEDYNAELVNTQYTTSFQGMRLDQKKVRESKHVMPDLPIYLDIRFGNLCNLRCRMCTGMYSSELGEELENIANKNEKFRLLAPDSAKTYTFDWYNIDSDIWTELELYMPHVKLIYLTGGEPTLVEGNYQFLQKLIEKGYAKNISLVFNTNVTNAQKRFLNIIGEFRRVSLNLSIDGIEGIQEYIRYPSKWSAITKNVSTIIDHARLSNTKIDLYFTPTVNIINVNNLHKIIEWAYNLASNNQHNNIKWDIQAIFLHGPEFMDMIHSTIEYRNLCLDNLNKVTKEQLQFFPCLEKFYNEVVDTLKNQYDETLYSASKRAQLKLWNKEIDKKRGINIKNYVSYSEMLYE